MSEGHVCGAFTGKKLTACCLCCGTPTYDILETYATGPRESEASRVGLMLESGTQVEMLLSDGSICHVDFCVTCAAHLQPAHLWDVWQRAVDRVDELARRANRRENQRRAMVRKVARLFPVGVLKWRHQNRDLVGVVPDGLAVDRRRPVPVIASAAPPPAKPARRRKSHAH